MPTVLIDLEDAKAAYRYTAALAAQDAHFRNTAGVPGDPQLRAANEALRLAIRLAEQQAVDDHEAHSRRGGAITGCFAVLLLTGILPMVLAALVIWLLGA